MDASWRWENKKKIALSIVFVFVTLFLYHATTSRINYIVLLSWIFYHKPSPFLTPSNHPRWITFLLANKHKYTMNIPSLFTQKPNTVIKKCEPKWLNQAITENYNLFDEQTVKDAGLWLSTMAIYWPYWP